VTNRSAGTVSFIDIRPSSGTLHQVVQTTAVESQPRGIAWEPGNEDILVCNEGSDSVSIISASTLQVRKVVKRGLRAPFAVAITPRQQGFGFQRYVYFAYILDRTGKVSIFESGPNGVNGWGYDDIVGQTPFAFANAKAIQPDPLRLESGVWIAHDGQLDSKGQPTGLGGGAVSNLAFVSGVVGRLPLDGSPPHLRDLVFGVTASIGSDELTGSPSDIAFDDQRNLGALVNFHTPFSAGAPVPINGKNLVRELSAGLVVNTNEPSYLFLPVRNSSQGTAVVDVIRISTRRRIDTNHHQPGIQSIPAGGAAIVMDYFRQ
jgi:YVTN family beta-propeller protein